MTVLAVLCCLNFSAALAQDDDIPVWEEDEAGLRAASDPPESSGPEVREPFFHFLTKLAFGDSIGQWSGAEILAFATEEGLESKFPVELFDRMVRRRPTQQEQISWPHAAVKAVWEVNLFENLNRPLPYSILGYHPGSLRISNQLLLTESHAGTMALSKGNEVFLVNDVIMLRLDQGSVLLDVDGWLDRLLGKGLDDSATVGFVLAREKGTLIGIAVSKGRNGRHIYGEFDFRQDKVLPNGRSAASALSAATRHRMLDGYEGPPLGAWVGK